MKNLKAEIGLLTKIALGRRLSRKQMTRVRTERLDLAQGLFSTTGERVDIISKGSDGSFERLEASFEYIENQSLPYAPREGEGTFQARRLVTSSYNSSGEIIKQEILRKNRSGYVVDRRVFSPPGSIRSRPLDVKVPDQSRTDLTEMYRSD